MEMMEISPLAVEGPYSGAADVSVAQLYEDFHQSLLRYIRGKIKRKEDGEDILHDVFARIAEKADALAQKENLKSWLFILTRNAIIDYYRKKGIRKHVELNEAFADSRKEDEAELQQATGGLDKCLGRFIDRLPETYKPILIDSELNGLKQKELAEKYQMPYSSLRSRVQRGREKVKQLLLVCCRIETDQWGNVLTAVPRQPCAGEQCKKCE
jgi:RNA polymerase sigma-70 factor (ECF subfamily)